MQECTRHLAQWSLGSCNRIPGMLGGIGEEHMFKCTGVKSHFLRHGRRLEAYPSGVVQEAGDTRDGCGRGDAVGRPTFLTLDA